MLFAGTTYPLDREQTASLLNFYGPTLNSMDSVSDRDYVIELFICSIYDHDAFKAVSKVKKLSSGTLTNTNLYPLMTDSVQEAVSCPSEKES